MASRVHWRWDSLILSRSKDLHSGHGENLTTMAMDSRVLDGASRILRDIQGPFWQFLPLLRWAFYRVG